MTSERWERTKQVLEDAMRLAPEKRAAFLDSACADDAELRKEVDSLIASYDDVGSQFLASPAAEVLGVPAVGVDEAVTSGKVIGPYQLVHKIGEGGMGEVWLAEQKHPVRRRVALKLVRAGLNTREALARFDSERQALALMEHPAIAKVFDGGATEQGAPYFVMEYVAGIPITDYCDQHRLSTKERLELFTQVCEGVQHAHQKAIIHRDLKPSNIQVAELDGKAAPKIIDFGVAKALTQQLTAETMFTRAGGILGTPGYMSPEQAGSSGEDIDTRTDVYSLGVVFYELLSGAMPLDLDLRKVALEEFLRRLREVEPPRPSTRLSTQARDTSNEVAKKRQTEPQTLVRQLQGELDSIALKALEKERSRRYPSASEFAADVRRYLNNEPVLAVPPSVRYRARKFARKHRVALGTAAAFAVVLIAATVVSIGQSVRANREAAAARRVSEFMTQMFKVSDPGEARGNSITAREILDKASKEIDTGLANDPQLQSQMMQTMGTVYDNLGLYPKAETLVRRGMEVRKATLGLENRETLNLQHKLAVVLQHESRFPEAEKLMRETMERQRRTFGPQDRNTLESAAELAQIFALEARYAEAEKLGQETLETATHEKGAEDEVARLAQWYVADTYGREGKYAQAEKLFRGIYEERRRRLGDDDPNTLAAQNELGTALSQLHRFPEAESMYRDCLAKSIRILGPEHPQTLSTLRTLAMVLYYEQRLPEAEKLQREALSALIKTLGPEHRLTLKSRQTLAVTLDEEGSELHDEGKVREAEQLIRETLESERRTLGPDHPDTLAAMYGLAENLMVQKRYPEAERQFQATLDAQRRVLGADNPACQCWTTAYNLATVQAHMGKRKEAYQNLEFSLTRHLPSSWLAGLEEDDDLQALHGDPRFKALVAKAQQVLVEQKSR